jgi:hypothetical protein
MILESKWEYTKGWHFKDLLRTTWVHDRSVDISKIFWEPLEFMVGVFRWHLILSSWFFCQLEIHGCKLQDKNLRKVWGSRKLKKDRQQNGQRKSDKKTNNHLQNTTQKTKDRATLIQLNTGGELRYSGRVSSSCSTCSTNHVTLLTKQ